MEKISKITADDVRHALSFLPEDVREQALFYFEKRVVEIPDRFPQLVDGWPTLGKFIDKAFFWHETSQGNAFWNALYKKYKKTEVPLRSNLPGGTPIEADETII